MNAYISPNALYSAAAKIIGGRTPLTVDCGQLCGSACCESGEEISGMYLFPRERMRYFPAPHSAHIYETDFEYMPRCFARLYTCDGTCDRRRRPLACMIFPLVPYAHRGDKLRIIIDPRGRAMCPLARTMTPSDLDGEFVAAVRRAMTLLMTNSECREFIYRLTEILDEELHYYRK